MAAFVDVTKPNESVRRQDSGGGCGEVGSVERAMERVMGIVWKLSV